jgi:hypothetical protein
VLSQCVSAEEWALLVYSNFYKKIKGGRVLPLTK